MLPVLVGEKMLITMGLGLSVLLTSLGAGGFTMLNQTQPQHQVEISESGQELLDDYKYCDEIMEKEDKEYFKELQQENFNIDDNEYADYKTDNGDRIERYVISERHKEMDLNYRELYRELPKDKRDWITQHQERANKNSWYSFDKENWIVTEYLNKYYYK